MTIATTPAADPVVPVPDPRPAEVAPPGRARRTLRDTAVDVAAIVVSLAGGAVVLGVALEAGATSDVVLALEVAVLLPASLVLWWRRRFPIALAVALWVAGTYLESVQLPASIAVFTVAVHRGARATAVVVGVGVASAVGFALLRPGAGFSWWGAMTAQAVVLLALAGWGTAVRHRRALLVSWRERAQRAEAEQDLRVAQARQLERTRIAREMHDVLAHRISLISMHAGALEYRTDATPAQVTTAAGVVRATAHQALEDLREVLGVLRSSDLPATGSGAGDGSTAVEPPQPSLADLTALVEDSRRAGARVDVEVRARLELVPAQLGRTAYRIAQEGLTNARKHAPGARVQLHVAGSPGGELEVRVVNPRGRGATAVPGSGTGLVGLSERVVIAGGRLAHGWRDERFELQAVLPWPAR